MSKVPLNATCNKFGVQDFRSRVQGWDLTRARVEAGWSADQPEGVFELVGAVGPAGVGDLSVRAVAPLDLSVDRSQRREARLCVCVRARACVRVRACMVSEARSWCVGTKQAGGDLCAIRLGVGAVAAARYGGWRGSGLRETWPRPGCRRPRRRHRGGGGPCEGADRSV